MEIENMVQQTHFNTGREYSPEGQEVSAWLVDLGIMLGHWVVFKDHSRCVTGMFEWYLQNNRDLTKRDLEQAVMRAYDNSQYTNYNVNIGVIGCLLDGIGQWDKTH